ncbi:MAG: hypothetical protein B7Y25_07145 [Alphaproteobacteria bacterium 16-39-46]|nr:MAG: hypothetical protein B7Y25_07145 [Alphaproteobacteria bacterium 16-39-46]OZA41827.1 MAG: hypothetical protein B7X84_07300 [Alphaproteobacteria bacterium 17-39-52]HQS84691.1 hypothetical protein [Alphaproteobacteria bacterium]HQS93110.1 hypothetical protein [Alphaproteobacteria bacterium]
MKYVLPFCTLILSGCATYNETFDCEPGKGVGCKSLSQVNHMVNEGKLPLSSEENPSEPPAPPIAQKNLRVWFAEHTDEEGIFYEDSLVYVPLKSGETS